MIKADKLDQTDGESFFQNPIVITQSLVPSVVVVFVVLQVGLGFISGSEGFLPGLVSISVSDRTDQSKHCRYLSKWPQCV